MSVDMTGAMREYLETKFNVPTFVQLPAIRPPKFLFIDRTGGGHRRLASDYPFFTIEAWATTKKEAYDLVTAVRYHVVRELPPLIGGIRIIKHAESAPPVYTPTTAAGSFRYPVTIAIGHQLVEEQ